jgi:WD40 repeat protein
VLSFDVHYEKQLVASSDADGLIKIWDFSMQLIREIKFTEAITAVCFLNHNGDLMAGHGGKLSRIQAENYLPGQYLVKNHPFKHFDFDLNPY